MKRYNGKKILAALLALSMILTLAPVFAGAAGVTSPVIYVSSAGNDAAVGTQADPLASLDAAYAAVSDGGTIYLMDNLTLMSRVVMNEDKTVTLDGQSSTATYGAAATIAPDKYGLLTVTAGTVVLKNITVQMPETPGANGRVLYIGSGGAVSLESGTVLANGYLGYGGGGVLIAGGKLTMASGAEIRNNHIVNNTTAYGGGVLMTSGAFTMTGGAITGNTIHTTQDYANYGGGVAVTGGAFTMTGGSIADNQVDTAGGGVYLAVAGALELGGSATITDNTATGTRNNLYLPTAQATFTQTSAATGEVGVTHGEADYNRIIGVPGMITAADEAAYRYDSGEYDIRFKGGNLVLYKWTVGVALDLTGCSTDFTEMETPLGEDFKLTITPDAGYQVPETVRVTVNGAPITDYIWTPETGELYIPGDSVTGDIAIEVSADALHTITVSTTHTQVDKAEMTVIQRDTTTITFHASPRYALPESVTVTGACTHNYDPATGKLTISNVTSDIAVSATGAEIPHTIHLDSGAGTVTPEAVVVNESQTTLGELPTPERAGYTFTGWFDTAGYKVSANTANDLTADLYLTAHWSANTNITYVVQHWIEWVDSGENPNYESGVTPTQTMEYQGETKVYYLYQSDTYHDGIADGMRDIAALTLDKVTTLKPAGLTPSGTNLYTVTMAADSSSVYPLYYERNRYTVTFDPNGGTLEGDATAQVVHGGLYGTLPTASRPGYLLEGWYESAAGGKQTLESDLCLITSDVTLYAHWQTTGDTAYTVTHMTQTLQDNLVGTDKVPENYAIYRVDTRYGDADSTVDVYGIAIPGFVPCEDNVYAAYINADGSGNQTLYYDRLVTTIEYDANGGTEVGMKTLIYYGGTVSSLAADPARTGYTFAGWYLGPEDSAQKVFPGTPLSDIDSEGGQIVVLYAHWTAREYDLTFDPGAGELNGEKTATYDQPLGDMPTAERYGYVFEGWTTPDGRLVDENMLVNTDAIIQVVDGQEMPVPLTARYKPIQVTVTFDPNGGSALPEEIASLSVAYDAVYGILPVASRSGYNFLGWFPNATDDGGEAVESNTVVSIAEDHTLYAHWKVRSTGGGGASRSIITSKPSSPFSGSHKAYVTGYVDGTFRPEGELARCEAVAIFARISESYDGSMSYPVSGFADVPANVWYSNYLGYCIQTGLFTGYVDGTFRPMDSITREEFAAVAARFLGLKADGEASFADVPADNWATGYIAQLAAKGIVEGNEAGLFDPAGSITRAATVKIINGLLERQVQNLPEGVHAFTDCSSIAWYYLDVQEAAHDHDYNRSTATGPEIWIQ